MLMNNGFVKYKKVKTIKYKNSLKFRKYSKIFLRFLLNIVILQTKQWILFSKFKKRYSLQFLQ